MLFDFQVDVASAGRQLDFIASSTNRKESDLQCWREGSWSTILVGRQMVYSTNRKAIGLQC